MTKQERYDELMSDSTEYCCYCGSTRYGFGCCGEVHFQTFAQMDKEEQDTFMADEEYNNG